MDTRASIFVNQSPGFNYVCSNSDCAKTKKNILLSVTVGILSTNVVKFEPLISTDKMTKHDQEIVYQVRFQCICIMQKYEDFSMEELRLCDYALDLEKAVKETPSQNNKLARAMGDFWAQYANPRNTTFFGTNTSPAPLFGPSNYLFQDTNRFGTFPTSNFNSNKDSGTFGCKSTDPKTSSNCLFQDANHPRPFPTLNVNSNQGSSGTPVFGSKSVRFETGSKLATTSDKNNTEIYRFGSPPVFGSSSASVGNNSDSITPEKTQSADKSIRSPSTDESVDKKKTADLLVAKIKSGDKIHVGSTGSFRVTQETDNTKTTAAPGIEFKLVPGDQDSKDVVVSSSLPEDFIIAFYGFGK